MEGRASPWRLTQTDEVAGKLSYFLKAQALTNMQTISLLSFDWSNAYIREKVPACYELNHESLMIVVVQLRWTYNQH